MIDIFDLTDDIIRSFRPPPLATIFYLTESKERYLTAGHVPSGTRLVVFGYANDITLCSTPYGIVVGLDREELETIVDKEAKDA